MARFLGPIGAVLALAALCLALTLGAGTASAGGFHRCTTTDQLKNHGILKLRASNATCKIARQVASAFTRGDDMPKGFTCTAGIGGNLIPYTCVRTASVVKFTQEG